MLYKRGVQKNFSKFSDKHKSSEDVLSKDVLKNFVKLAEKHLCRSLLFNKVATWKPYIGRSCHWRSVKQGVLKFRWKNSVLESLFNKVGVLRACNFIKEDSDTDFFCEIYKLFKNDFEEHLWTSASKHYLKRNSNSGAFLWIL